MTRHIKLALFIIAGVFLLLTPFLLAAGIWVDERYGLSGALAIGAAFVFGWLAAFPGNFPGDTE